MPDRQKAVTGGSVSPRPEVVTPLGVTPGRGEGDPLNDPQFTEEKVESRKQAAPKARAKGKARSLEAIEADVFRYPKTPFSRIGPVTGPSLQRDISPHPAANIASEMQEIQSIIVAPFLQMQGRDLRAAGSAEAAARRNPAIYDNMLKAFEPSVVDQAFVLWEYLFGGPAHADAAEIPESHPTPFPNTIPPDPRGPFHRSPVDNRHADASGPHADDRQFRNELAFGRRMQEAGGTDVPNMARDRDGLIREHPRESARRTISANDRAIADRGAVTDAAREIGEDTLMDHPDLAAELTALRQLITKRRRAEIDN